ncbi:MAG: DUF89 family protein [Elusimicrobia bacterium]|nr:DUF89 family protein [Elusimicrobiota bacterium]
MKTYLDCFPCILRQSLEATRLSTADKEKQKKVLGRVMEYLIKSDSQLTPPHIACYVYDMVRKITGYSDPYYSIKKKYNRIALNMYPKLKNIIRNSNEPLLTAVRLAIAGNIIDFGVGNRFNLKNTLKKTLSQKFAVCRYSFFKEKLKKTKVLLYLGDNSGEIVFDKILIEEILKRYKLKIYYAVKSGPIINDATLDDANEVKMKDVAEVITTGSSAPGTILSLCSKEFKNIYDKAQLIISKGQGNYETLDTETGKNIFFLLKVKCALVAGHLRVKLGDIVFK